MLSKEYLSEHKGKYPVYSSQTKNNGEIGQIDTFDYDGEYVTWTTDGAYAGTVFYRNEKFSITNICGLLNSKTDKIINKFIFYWLQIEAKKHVKGGSGTPKLMSNIMADIKVPVPSIETQKKIVEILDKFTEYVTELQAELQDRTLQYNYYRDKLLSEEYLDRKWVLLSTTNKIVWKSIKEICTFRRGQSITFKDVVEGNVPVISGGQKPAYYHNVSNRVGKTIAIAGSGVNAGYVSYWEIPVFLNDAFSIEPFSDIDTKYLYYFLQSQQNKIYSFKKGSGVPHVYGEDIGTLKIPIPPPAIQQEVVNILDKFQDILKDTEGVLPTEIEQRQKQYEYYREKLLTFGIESGTASQPASQPAINLTRYYEILEEAANIVGVKLKGTL